MTKHSYERIHSIVESVRKGNDVVFGDAYWLLSREAGKEIDAIIEGAHDVFVQFHEKVADVCALVNAKSGACQENCAFCAQSMHWNTGTPTYPLQSTNAIVARAKEAEANGAKRFCIVTSGGAVSDDDFQQIVDAYIRIKNETTLLLDGSLGFLSDERMDTLRHVGVSRINHNLETSPEHFAVICTTHSFTERRSMIERLKRNGFEVCSGGILGVGEDRHDRIAMAFILKEVGVDCVPINILNPRPGTPCASCVPLSRDEIIKTIAVFRLILPHAIIKLAAGREMHLGCDQARALYAGANGIIIGGYLTTTGNAISADFALLQSAGLIAGHT